MSPQIKTQKRHEQREYNSETIHMTCNSQQGPAQENDAPALFPLVHKKLTPTFTCFLTCKTFRNPCVVKNARTSCATYTWHTQLR